ncbi:hypothetical protein O7608_10435 [Solwaraspora sp. WMMA2056]|uniref:hypothetical protein n=1 Tax=Solwaraspora sp. WMMA2056 TaxID=3015161 RepID=UPI00259AF7C1|nr:hypothetical protein [Solwaraspora sp. WMMA2056]WJK42755.1 hypothetical protein O7608_10435 [Solwaraspora sp. WMMA2056]
MRVPSRTQRPKAVVTAAATLAAALTVAAPPPPATATATAAVATATATVGASDVSAGQWLVADLGTPTPKVDRAEVVGAVTVDDHPGGAQQPYVFTVVDGALYLTLVTGGRSWVPLGVPPSGSPIAGGIGAITVRDSPASPARPHVFLRTADGQLWSRWWDGGSWNWSGLGAPPGAAVTNGVGVVAVADAPGAAQRPYVFVLGTGGQLWLNWWTGARWRWEGLGTPDVVHPQYTTGVGVGLIQLAPENPQWPQAFVVTGEGEVWRNGWDGSGWRWTDHGVGPAGPQPTVGLDVTTAAAPAGATVAPIAFTGVVYGLYSLSYPTVGPRWTWSDQDLPYYDVQLPVSAGAVSVTDSPTSASRPYLFICDAITAGPVRANWWDGTGWQWTELPGTKAAPGWPRCGAATTVRDTASGPQRPFVYYWSPGADDDQVGHLMVSWWVPPAAPADVVGKWHVTAVGNPVPEARSAQLVGALAVDDQPGGQQRPAVFNLIDGQLYGAELVAGRWRWSWHGVPQDAAEVTAAGAVTVRDGADSAARPYVFVVADGRLWCRWWDGANWTWSDLGAPPGAEIAVALGVVAVRDGPGAPQRPYVFVDAVDGAGAHRAWSAWWTGLRWQWSDHGNPLADPTYRLAPVGAAVMRYAPDAPEFPQLFVIEPHRRVWQLGWDGSRWSWSDRGSPGSILTGLGVTTTTDAGTGLVRPWVFVGQWAHGVYALSYAGGGQWAWADHQGPQPSALAPAPAGVLTVADRPGADQRPYVFICDHMKIGGPISVNWYVADGRWTWSNQDGTRAVPGQPGCGSAVAITDAGIGPQRPYVFYWTPRATDSVAPDQLTVNWWG